MTTATRLIPIAIFAALTCSIAAMSFASDRFDALQVKVKYGDLDVSSTSGAATLYKRIQGAAEAACRPWNHGDLYYRNIFHACVRKTVSNAVNELNQPVLFTVANAKAAAITPNVIATGNGR
ncbi:MAG TPA: UrcA family protein [Steroidobacteraceae bacterium]